MTEQEKKIADLELEVQELKFQITQLANGMLSVAAIVDAYRIVTVEQILEAHTRLDVHSAAIEALGELYKSRPKSADVIKFPPLRPVE
jgi:hypothetical protein